ncbi:MAG: thymidine phosphorylase [Candidatus Krumholzibacteria bacterium]|nr:thymidine phosphorylase [Candidatus Krumholzibacteria bacterium]
MNIIEIISKKRDGAPLNEDEIRYVTDGFVAGEIADYQMSALLMAVVLNGMTGKETVAMTRAMMESGTVFDIGPGGGPLIDKHSTGGVGDKISLILLPVAVECGLRVPMISGRGLGFTGGTLDKLESIPGLVTDLEPRRFEELVIELGGCFGAQTDDIVPADRKIYALRDATATVQSIPLITASILSKKFAEGIGGVVIDVKCGNGAFMQRAEDARMLSESLEMVGQEMGIGVRTVITSMEQPLGNAAGNAIEVIEAVSALHGEGPEDCAELVNRLVAEMLLLGGLVETLEDGRGRSADAIASGRALERFHRIVEAQGGELDLSDANLGLPIAPVTRPGPAPRSGNLAMMDPRTMGEVIRELGGGRLRTDDEIDPAVGFHIYKKKGDPVLEGEAIFDVHARNDVDAERAVRRMLGAISIIDEPVSSPQLFL